MGLLACTFHAVPVVVCPSKSSMIFRVALGRECKRNVSAKVMAVSCMLGCIGGHHGQAGAINCQFGEHKGS